LSFNIPPSEKEVEAVRLAMKELKESLTKSSQLAGEFVEMLEENFLAIDEWNRKELFTASMSIDVALWDLRVSLYKMRDYKSRIIGPAS